MTDATDQQHGGDAAPPHGGDLVRRHRLSTRIWHWINAFTVFVMLMSGLMIFNAHPRLYWGQYGANFDRPWLQIGATGGGDGLLIVGKTTFFTTGLLGSWKDAGRSRAASRLSLVGDDPLELQPRRRAALASRLRLGAGDRRAGLLAAELRQSPCPARPFAEAR
jgi:hypothetical protein